MKMRQLPTLALFKRVDVVALHGNAYHLHVFVVPLTKDQLHEVDDKKNPATKVPSPPTHAHIRAHTQQHSQTMFSHVVMQMHRLPMAGSTKNTIITIDINTTTKFPMADVGRAVSA